MSEKGVPERDLGTNRTTRHHAAASGNLRLKTTGITGEMVVLIAAVARAKMYEVEYTMDLVNGPWTMVLAFDGSRGMKLTELTRGKAYYVRACVVASSQNRGPWSDIASALAM